MQPFMTYRQPSRVRAFTPILPNYPGNQAVPTLVKPERHTAKACYITKRNSGLPGLATKRKRGREDTMPGLVHTKPDTVPFTRQCDGPASAAVPGTAAVPARAADPGTAADPGSATSPDTATPQVPGPRHARTPAGDPPHRTALSIRSAERRRWSADLTGPDLTGLVVHGIGGIGKSTLAAQIAARACRLQPWRVVTVVSGEIGTHSLPIHPNEADLLVLDNFDDNLSGNGTGTGTGTGRIVRDPALAALLANWAGMLLIT